MKLSTRIVRSLILVCITICFMGSGVWRYILPNGTFLQGMTSAGAIQDIIGVASGSGNTVIDSPTGSSILFQRNAATQFSIDSSGNIVQGAGADVVLTTTNTALRSDKADGSDNFAFYITAGGAINTSGTRGALIEMQGNEAGSAGRVILQSGNSTGTATFGTRGSGDVILMSNALTRWTVNSGGDLIQDGTNGGSLIFNKSTGDIRENTSDGADNACINVSGGGASNSGRGAVITTCGNENGSNGLLSLATGNSTNSHADIFLNAASSLWRLRNSGGTTVVQANVSGQLTSAGTSDLGWSVQSATNQACNTTCTSACVFGHNLTAGVPGAMLACTDATADECLCAGAS